MKILANLSRVLVGAYLIFSGFLKIVDPYGTALKLKEYFQVFGEDLPALKSFFEVLGSSSVVLSVIFCCLEFLIGVALLFGFRLKFTAWVALLLMSFFTFLTFYSAYFNKVTDCGCFGEFLKLEPWSSFYKNVVTIVLILIVFFYRKRFNKSTLGTPAVLIGAILSLGIAIYSLSFLPVIDMLPYAVGKSLPEQMKVPDVKPVFEYEFLDKTNNKTVKSEEYLMDTARFEYVNSVLLNEKDIKPALSDFSVLDTTGVSAVNEILTDLKLVLIFRTLDDTENLDFKNFRELVNKLNKSHVKPAVIAADYGIADYLKANKMSSYSYYFGDEKLLKAMARNNPVVYLFKEGVVIGKWSFNKLPSDSDIKKLIK